VEETTEAQAASGADSARWLNGVILPRNECDAPTDNYWWDGCDLGDGGQTAEALQTAKGTASGYDEWVEQHPFTIFVPFGCGFPNAGSEEFATTALAQMEAWQSFMIARELSTSFVKGSADWDDKRFTNDLTNDGDPFSPVVAFAEAEGYLGTCDVGGQGMIHVNPEVATYLIRAGLVFPEGNGRRLRSMLGTIVAVDAGYTGAFEDDTDNALQATGLIRIFLGPVKRLVMEPVDAANHPYGIDIAEMDFTHNKYVGLVERQVLVAWGCCNARWDVTPQIDIEA
jgi:hypothetical protein